MPRKSKKNEKDKLPTEDMEKKAEQEEEPKKKKKEKWKKITRRQFTVDFWRTSLHGEKIGIRQKDQQRAISRQFSKDMELYGEIREGHTEIGNIGFRNKEWNEYDITKGKLSRLIIRFFDENGHWEGSIEEDTVLGMAYSLAYKEALPAFNLFIKGNSKIFKITPIEEGISDKLIMPIILQKDGKIIDFLLFDRKQFTMGDDWEIYRLHERKKILADLDSKKLDIGGKVEVRIYDPELKNNKIFINTLILFASTIKFFGEVKKKLKEAFKLYIEEGFPFKPDRPELQLFINPRRFNR
ncbi:MAG: hypothetical protein ACTSQI_06905 [Candidatus Helarchaeota archaeon]